MRYCLVGTLHDTSKSVKDRLGCEILRGYEVNEVLLPAFLLQHTGQILAVSNA